MRAFHDGNKAYLAAIDFRSGAAGGICAGVCVFVSVCSVSFSGGVLPGCVFPLSRGDQL